LEKAEDPQKILKDCFEFSVRKAIEVSTDEIGNPDRIGVYLYSGVLDYPLYLPFGNINRNISEDFLRLFGKIDQSAKQRSGSILGEPFKICVTTSNVSALEANINATGQHQTINGHHRKSEIKNGPSK